MIALRWRASTLALSLSLALAACGGTDPVIDVPVGGGPTASATASDGGTPDASGSDTPSDGTGTDAPSGEPSGDPSASPSPDETTSQAPAATAADDAAGVGANGRAMLRGDRSRIIVEIDVQEGVSADQGAVDHLVDEVGRHVDKADGFAFAGGNTFSDSRTQWSIEDLRAAVAAHRSTATDDDEVSVHVLYLRGGLYRDGEETSAIGVAYSASTIAIFPEKWSGLTGLLGSSRAIERAVLVHEFGHLLGLVNLTYTSDVAHEDGEHPGHSNNQGSVMYYAIETTLIGQVFSGPPPDRFDDADAADLDGLRSGRY